VQKVGNFSIRKVCKSSPLMRHFPDARVTQQIHKPNVSVSSTHISSHLAVSTPPCLA